MSPRVCRDKTAECQLSVCISGSGVDSFCYIVSGCDAVKPELLVAPRSFCILAGDNVQLHFLFGQLDKTALAVFHDNFVLRIKDGPVGRYDLIGVSLIAPVSGISVKIKIVARDRLHKAIFELSVLRIILSDLDRSPALVADAVGAHILPFCPARPLFVQSGAALQHKCVRELPVVVCHVLKIVGIRNRAVLLQERDFLFVQVVYDLHCRVRSVVGRDSNFLYFLRFDVVLRRRNLPQIVSSGYKALKRRITAVICRRGELISCCILDRLCMLPVCIQAENSLRNRQSVVRVVCLENFDFPKFLFAVKRRLCYSVLIDGDRLIRASLCFCIGRSPCLLDHISPRVQIEINPSLVSIRCRLRLRRINRHNISARDLFKLVIIRSILVPEDCRCCTIALTDLKSGRPRHKIFSGCIQIFGIAVIINDIFLNLNVSRRNITWHRSISVVFSRLLDGILSMQLITDLRFVLGCRLGVVPADILVIPDHELIVRIDYIHIVFRICGRSLCHSLRIAAHNSIGKDRFRARLHRDGLGIIPFIGRAAAFVNIPSPRGSDCHGYL